MPRKLALLLFLFLLYPTVTWGAVEIRDEVRLEDPSVSDALVPNDTEFTLPTTGPMSSSHAVIVDNELVNVACIAENSVYAEVLVRCLTLKCCVLAGLARNGPPLPPPQSVNAFL